MSNLKLSETIQHGKMYNSTKYPQKLTKCCFFQYFYESSISEKNVHRLYPALFCQWKSVKPFLQLGSWPLVPAMKLWKGFPVLSQHFARNPDQLRHLH